MKNICIITAKGNNTSIRNKNLLDVCGKSLLEWQINAAKEAMLIDDIYISTECKLIKSEGIKHGIKIIDRPQSLSLPYSNHGDVIMHAAKFVSEMIGNNIDTITILLGNTVFNRGIDIDNNISTLVNTPDASSAMTVWHAQDDHPYRAMTINQKGYLQSWMNPKDHAFMDTNRQTYPDVFYYDQGPWTVRYEVLIKSEKNSLSPACWWWMGENCIPIIRKWITGKDVHDSLDVEIAKSFIKDNLWRFM